MGELSGVHVLVTRPGSPGRALQHALRAAGAEASHFPAIAIEALSPSLSAFAATLASPAALSVFVSRHAAEHGIEALRRNGLLAAWRSAIAAVGDGTAATLRDVGVDRRILVPRQGTGAQALLDNSSLGELAARPVIVFRGEGGSPALADGLRRRGADVHLIEVYRRAASGETLTAARLADVDLVITASAESLRLLYAAATPEALQTLSGLPLLVTSERAADLARSHGQRISPIITPQVSNRQLVEEVIRWRTTRN